MKNFKTLVAFVIIISLGMFLTGCDYKFKKSSEETPVAGLNENSELLKDEKVKEIIEKETPAVDKKEKRAVAFLNSLDEAVSEYEAVVADYLADPSVENENNYKQAWGKLKDSTAILDGMNKDYTPEQYILINNKFIELDNLMREKKSSEEVNLKKDEIVALFE